MTQAVYSFNVNRLAIIQKLDIREVVHEHLWLERVDRNHRSSLHRVDEADDVGDVGMTADVDIFLILVMNSSSEPK